MLPGCLQDFSRMFSGCSDGSYRPGGIWWSFQMKVWTLLTQRNSMIPNYSMIPVAAIWWFPGIRWSLAIRWSVRSMDFDNRKVFGDTSITDGLVSSGEDSVKLIVVATGMEVIAEFLESSTIHGLSYIQTGKSKCHYLVLKIVSCFELLSLLSRSKI